MNVHEAFFHSLMGYLDAMLNIFYNNVKGYTFELSQLIIIMIF